MKKLFFAAFLAAALALSPSAPVLASGPDLSHLLPIQRILCKLLPQLPFCPKPVPEPPVEPEPVPEPAPEPAVSSRRVRTQIQLDPPRRGDVYRVGEPALIIFSADSQHMTSVRISSSTNSGETWSVVDGNAFAQSGWYAYIP